MSDQNFPGQFPSEIIAEILTRLPAKSVFRFKSVSKTWKSQICNPHFITSYISHNSLSSSWVIFDPVISFNTESKEEATQFEPPNISSLFANPHLLASEPVTDPSRSRFPAVILSSSNGFLLFTLKIDRDPHKEHKKNPNHFWHIRSEDALFVINPITGGWVPLPKPPSSIYNQASVGFITRVDSSGVLEKFLVVEYQPFIGGGFAHLLCFSSDTGKWVTKSVNYMLETHPWRGDEVFEFAGRLCWVDLSCGIIAWEVDDPFRAGVVEEKESGVCRFIPLPRECMKLFNTQKLQDEREIYGSGGYIHYIEVFKKEDYVLKLWRLKDYGSCGEEWNLVYNVSRVDYLAFGLKKSAPRSCFIHPFEVDVVFFETGDRIFSYNFQSRKVESCASFTGHKYVPFVIPIWPTSLPPCLCAAYMKVKGNAYFKDKKFSEAIKFYSRSIALSPNALAYANRAMAYLKVGRFREAEVDCTEALNLDGEYVKVYGRRAIARKELGNLVGSMQDIEFALKLEPKNKEMKQQHDEIKPLLEKACCMRT